MGVLEPPAVFLVHPDPRRPECVIADGGGQGRSSAAALDGAQRVIDRNRLAGKLACSAGRGLEQRDLRARLESRRL
jgi:hypothetical protein